MTEAQPDLGPVLHRLGRKSSIQLLLGPVLVLWGVVYMFGRGIDSFYGVMGLVMVVVGLLMLVVSLGATVNVHQGGLSVRSSFFQTTLVPWSAVAELVPSTGSFSTFRIVGHDGTIVMVDRLSLKPVFDKTFDAVPHKDVQLVLDHFATWQTSRST